MPEVDSLAAPPDGTAIISWFDSSGNGNRMDAITVKPTYKANLLNGLPVVRFGGVFDECLHVANGNIGAQPNTIFIVGCKRGLPADDCRFTGYNGAQMTGIGGNGNFYVYAGVSAIDSAHDVSGAYHVFSAVYSGGNGTGWVDGVLRIPTAPVGTFGLANMYWMSDVYTLSYKGDIAEVVIFNVALSDADRKAVENHLIAKYALPQPIPFDPSTIPGMQGWWKADGITTGSMLREALEDRLGLESMTPRITDGDPVSLWPDSSVNGRNAGLWVGANAIYKANIVNGKPIVRFGAGTGFQMTAIPTTSGFTVFSVMKPRLATSEINTVATQFGSNNWGPLANGTNYFVAIGGGGGYYGTPDANWHVFAATASAAGVVALYIDGAGKSLTPFGAFGTPPPFNCLGARDGALSSDGDIAEIIVYQGVLSVKDRAIVEDYLSTKYAITVVKPEVPETIPGLKGWWAADKITAGALLREALESRDKLEIMPADVDPKAAPADGAGVTIWTDASGSGYSLAPYPSPGNTPFYKTNILNGKPVVRFDGAISGMRFPVIPVSQPNTWFWVVNETNKALQHVLKWDTAGQIIYLDPSGFLQVYAGSGANDTIDHSGAFHIFTVIFSGGNVTAYVDGVLRIGPVACGTQPSGEGFIGTTGSGFNPGDIAEFLIYNSALSTTDRQKIESYLKTKYALP